MIKKEEEPRRAESAPVNSAPTFTNSLVLEYTETATKLFRKFLTEFLAERERGQGVAGSANWMAVAAEGSLESVLQMIGKGGECPLPIDDFRRIVGKSSFARAVPGASGLAEESKATATSNEWEIRNRRRLDLIGRSLAANLSPGETAELQQLQTELDKRLEAGDDRLLEQLRLMREAAARLPREPSSQTEPGDDFPLL